MQYILKKDLPTHKAGTPCHISAKGNLVATEDGIVVYEKSTLSKFPNILTEWFEPVEEKRKAVPDYKDKFYTIGTEGDVWECTLQGDEKKVHQGNWRWTREEAEAEVKKRAAIERVRRYLVSNDLLEEDNSKQHITVHTNLVSKLVVELQPRGYSSYTPYGHIKDIEITQFLKDCREDLLLIHS